MNVQLDFGAVMPKKAYKTDAGFDIFSRETKVVPARGSQTFDTGVHICLPLLTAGVLMSKSGLNVNHNITTEGVIDYGYTGSIIVKLYNNGDTYYKVEVGDKIAQLLIIPIVPVELNLVDKIDGGLRGNNGFGSSGR